MIRSSLPYLVEDDSSLADSGQWTGESCVEAQQKMAAFAKANGFGTATVTYRLKDWGVSRQRYWGTPIPMVYCANGHGALGLEAAIEPGGVVPLPESALPVLLARAGGDHPAGRFAAGPRCGVCQYHLPGLRRPGPPRDRHDGHLRRFQLVLLPLHRRKELRPRRSIRRRRTTGSPSTSTSAAWSTPSCT